MDMGGKSWKNVESDQKKRARQGAEDAGFHFDRKLGKGQMGEVYLVENKKTGERNAMKHVVKALYGGPKTSKREAENYRFAMNNKASMNEKFAKYLPDVYNVEETVKDYFIFMELLEEIPDRMKADLFALAPGDEKLSHGEKYDRIIKDPEAIYDIISAALYGNTILAQGDSNVEEQIRMEVPNAVIKRIMQLSPKETDRLSGDDVPERLSEMVVEESLKYLKQDPSYFYSLASTLEASLTPSLAAEMQKQIVPIHSGHGSNSWAGGSMDSLERNFPEADGLVRAMKYFHQSEHWQPKDIHSGNVMIRPGTKNFVITDLGLFSLA